MNAKEWLIVLAGGAAGPAAILGAAPLTLATGIAAGLAFLVGAGAAAKAMHMPSVQQRKKDARGQAEDDEEPR